MAASRRIVVTVPAPLLEQVDVLAAMAQTDRNALIHEALRIYVEERKKRDMRERMRRGYREMSRINLTLAEEGPIFERIGSLP
ncbi:CopG family transcriptional regulator/antitoxin EndoAI [Symbiobacterium terraclitae]|uniref:CopG family transcriptional regulator/antitoxin EndoAI n=1 Tax=Symbiobacterium terraclitae TaxID=557451 RepID=A0ABS4JNH3_9FIRM|nr:ribbon-helix-helix protein, CopG family [Symbiobacterium terraclitae]MBP2017064.1 CopG family transcriptional regulator/antitoxin EndoAI [Symbiobacterium terraclitae]